MYFIFRKNNILSIINKKQKQNNTYYCFSYYLFISIYFVFYLFIFIIPIVKKSY